MFAFQEMEMQRETEGNKDLNSTSVTKVGWHYETELASIYVIHKLTSRLSQDLIINCINKTQLKFFFSLAEDKTK